MHMMNKEITQSVNEKKSAVLRQNRGASLTGYGLIMGLIAITAITAISGVGQQVTTLFGIVGERMAAVSGEGISGDSETSPDEDEDQFLLGATSCQEHFDAGETVSGIFEIDLDGEEGPEEPFDVYCDMTTHGGGWTLIGAITTNVGPTLGWDTALTGTSWYAGNLYSPGAPVNLMTIVKGNSGAPVAKQYEGIFLDQDNGAFNTTGDTYVQFLVTSNLCSQSTSLIDNYQITIAHYEPVLGLEIIDSAIVFIGRGRVSSGCGLLSQTIPAIAYPNNTYGDLGASFELYAK